MQAEPAVRIARLERKAVLRPLAPVTFLLRNQGKSLPLIGVIVLAVMLIAGIIAMIDSIPLSIRTIYGYNRQMLGVGPRGDPTLTPTIVKEVQAGSPVPIERVMICRAAGVQINSIVGKWPFVVLGLSPRDMDYYLRRQGSNSISGRLPNPGAAEAVVSEPVARNLHLRLGSVLLSPEEADSYSPHKVRVVGIASTSNWIMFSDIGYFRANHFPPIDLALICARTLADQDVLDRWAVTKFKGQRAQVFAYFQIEKQSNEMFQTLFKILDVVIATLVLVVTVMTGMIINIYQAQRLIEFGLLQAIGHAKKRLLARSLIEASTLVILGWLLGVVAAHGLLLAVKTTLLDPSAFSIDTMDATALRFTLPVPIAIIAVTTMTLVIRFRKFDPVGVVERRLA